MAILRKYQTGNTLVINDNYYYPKRPDAVYKMNDAGQWLIKSNNTNGKFVVMKDPTGSRAAELERNAVPESEYLVMKNQKNALLKNEIIDKKAPTFYLEDKRTVRATTNSAMNPNRDLMHGSYNLNTAKRIVEHAKEVGVDPYLALAVGLRESQFGKSDVNIGHVSNYLEGSNPYTYVDILKQKMEEARKNGINDERHMIQYYNGTGKLFPSTEKEYHGGNSQSFYGVPITNVGIDLKQNPLYGIDVLDLRENVIKKNPALISLVSGKSKLLYKK